jgi:transposase
LQESAAGESLLAQVIVRNVADHLPVHRQAKIFRRFGVEIPAQTMSGWMRQSAELLDPLYARLKLLANLGLRPDLALAGANRRDVTQQE